MVRTYASETVCGLHQPESSKARMKIESGEKQETTVNFAGLTAVARVWNLTMARGTSSWSE